MSMTTTSGRRRWASVVRLADNVHVFFCVEQSAEALPHDRMVIR